MPPGEDVVDAAVADVVGPTIAAEHPHRGFHEQVREAQHLRDLWRLVLLGLEQRGEAVGDFLGDGPVLGELQPLLQAATELGAHHAGALRECRGDAVAELNPTLSHGQELAAAELRVVLKERVAPRDAAARGLVLRVWHPARGATPNAAATGGVRNDQALAEHLGDELRIRSLAASLASTREL
eukprot:CAMPEP_0170284044 /NCGR_PEP_ID=MMETSP0116_2-20130129/42059_1 /TAXON_ID=400756 /ORGANISM="Durinskia baltica, Strain CSIRO CS-38" /LENGTH=182 /DNA_ID=CAMNT_0010535421 /DNA_START=170 /DNA_END=715 /DNA_ORIENTATION=-